MRCRRGSPASDKALHGSQNGQHSRHLKEPWSFGQTCLVAVRAAAPCRPHASAARALRRRVCAAVCTWVYVKPCERVQTGLSRGRPLYPSTVPSAGRSPTQSKARSTQGIRLTRGAREGRPCARERYSCRLEALMLQIMGGISKHRIATSVTIQDRGDIPSRCAPRVFCWGKSLWDRWERAENGLDEVGLPLYLLLHASSVSLEHGGH